VKYIGRGKTWQEFDSDGELLMKVQGFEVAEHEDRRIVKFFIQNAKLGRKRFNQFFGDDGTVGKGVVDEVMNGTKIWSIRKVTADMIWRDERLRDISPYDDTSVSKGDYHNYRRRNGWGEVKNDTGLYYTTAYQIQEGPDEGTIVLQCWFPTMSKEQRRAIQANRS